MSASNERYTRTLEIYLASEDASDEQWRCLVCADDIDEGDEYVNHPAPEYGERALVAAHPWCAVENGYLVKDCR